MLVDGLHYHELLRARWQRARSDLNLVDCQDEQFALGGVAVAAPDLSVRFMILPADPEAYVVEFDEEFWNWWRQDRAQPFGDRRSEWGGKQQPTASAAVRFEEGNRGWRDYAALHRSGAFEFGLGNTGFYDLKSCRVFRLLPVVGRIWVSIDLYRHVLDRYDGVEGPWELTLVLRDTAGSALGEFAQGHPGPENALSGLRRCAERALLFRREVTGWPKGDAARLLALSFGAWMEDAWGSRARRFMARSGGLEGEFDHASFYWRW